MAQLTRWFGCRGYRVDTISADEHEPLWDRARILYHPYADRCFQRDELLMRQESDGNGQYAHDKVQSRRSQYRSIFGRISPALNGLGAALVDPLCS